MTGFRILLLALWAGAPLAGLAGDSGIVGGVVRDSSGAVVSGAEVRLETRRRTVARSSRSDAAGRFTLEGVSPDAYALVVQARGFLEARAAVRVELSSRKQVDVVLRPSGTTESVTVTAELGEVGDAAAVAQQVNVVPREQIEERFRNATAEVVRGEVGVQLQRTSSSIAGVHIRGLTGSRVNVFVDGVRYSTSAMRSGINTFLNLIEPSSIDSVEVLRGPSSATYGSDALGGSLQFLTRPAALASGDPEVGGTLGTFFSTADSSFGSTLSTHYHASRFGALADLAGRRINRLRPGGGFDSHSSLTRYLGIRSDALDGARLPDTGFTQYGGTFRGWWFPTPVSELQAFYSRGQEDGARRYDQLLGGDGNLIADLRNLMLDFFYLKYDRLRAGWIDDLTIAYSFNAQREERVNQGGGGDLRAPIEHEYERTGAHGLQAQALGRVGRHALALGIEYHRERIRSPAWSRDPVTGRSSTRRPRIPDDASYRSGAAFVADSVELLGRRLRLTGSARYAASRYEARARDSAVVDGRPLWPDDALATSAVTFRAGAALALAGGWSASASVARGFRAPNMTDLGTLGLTGSGFEVAARDVERLGATLGSSASASAAPTAIPVRQVRPETSLSYEAAVLYRRGRLEGGLALFLQDISNVIEKTALILPAGAVGLELGGQPIVRQSPSGAVFVAATPTPVLARANFGGVRLYGAEQKLEVRLSSAWSATGSFSYVHAAERATGLPPSVEGGTPAPQGDLRMRYSAARRGLWVEAALHAAARQSRLSALGLEDRRVGAARSRASIADFFYNGATARGLVDPGPDGAPGTADDTLHLTGETLAHIQDRVLGAGVDAAPLFTALPGYLVVHLRGGFELGERSRILVALENLGDRNYRGMAWGLDGPGRSLYVRYARRF